MMMRRFNFSSSRGRILLSKQYFSANSFAASNYIVVKSEATITEAVKQPNKKVFYFTASWYKTYFNKHFHMYNRVLLGAHLAA